MGSHNKCADNIPNKVIEPLLLNPNGWKADVNNTFDILTAEECFALCRRAITVLDGEVAWLASLCCGVVCVRAEWPCLCARMQSMCVPVPAPAKVFGDIHGQIYDLLSFFHTYGSPNHLTGDVEVASECKKLLHVASLIHLLRVACELCLSGRLC